MNRIVDTVFDDVIKSLGVGNYEQYTKRRTAPREYVQRKTDEGYKIEIPAIGAGKNDVSVKVEDNILKVIVKPTVDSAYAKEFDCAWSVPDNVDTENLSAKLENGLLSVTLKYIVPVTKKVNIDVAVN